jgi:hypothetical protein
VAILANTSDAGDLNGRSNNNTNITNTNTLASTFGNIRVLHEGNGQAIVEIKNNPIVSSSNIDLPVGVVAINGTNAAARLDITLDNNEITNTTTTVAGLEGIVLRVGTSPSGTKINTLCGNVKNNKLTLPITMPAYPRAFRASFLDPSSFFNLQGGASVADHWTSNLNTNTAGIIAQGPTLTFTFSGTCAIPTHTNAFGPPAEEELDALATDGSAPVLTNDAPESIQEAPDTEDEPTQETTSAMMAFSGETVTVGGFLLPAGQTMTIVFRVTINDPFPLGVCSVSNQGTVSGGNFANVLTDDPDVAGAANPTVTELTRFPLGNLVYNDVNRNGIFDAGDTGINGVVLNLYVDVNNNNMLDAGDGIPIDNTTTLTVGMQAGTYNFDVCSGKYILEVAPSNFAMGGALYNGGQPLVSSPTTAAPDPDFSTTDNDDNGNAISGFGVATQAFSVSAAINHVDFGFKTPTTVTISDLALNEGNGGGTTSFNFTVNRSDFDDAFSLTVNTTDGTASSASDYTAVSGGTVSFLAGGSLTATVTVLVNRDAMVEANETFTVNLSGAPAGIYITDAQALGTITNDDNASVTLSGGISQSEGNAGTTTYTFTATLDNPVQGGFTVPYTTGGGTATDGTDYTDNDGTLTFAGTAGETQTWTVNVNGDVTVELTETFEGALGAIAGGPAGVTTAGSPQTATITNDDAATVSIAANVSQSEAIGTMPFSITLSNPVDVSVTVIFGSSNGTATVIQDYASLTGASVIFPANTTSPQTLNANIVADNIVEADEVFNVSIGGAFASGRNVTATGASRTGTIVNDDASVLSINMVPSQAEGNSGTTNYTYVVTASNAVQGGFSLAYTTNNGTANAGTDYVDNDGTLSFPEVNTPQNIVVQANGDLLVEADETFTVQLGTITAPTTVQTNAISISVGNSTGTILNDEQDWGDAPSAAQSGFAASYPTLLADNGARHSAALGGLRLGATIEGNTDGVPNATATGDNDEDGLTLPSNFILNLPSNIIVNASATGKLDAWFDWNRDGDWNDAGEQVFTNQSVVAGNNTLSVTTPAGASVGASFARFRLSTAGGLAPTGAALDGEVEDYQINIQNVSLSVNDVMLTETNSGTTNAQFTVSLNNPAPAGGVTFDISTADNTATTANNDYVAQTLTNQVIPAGMDSYTFTVLVNGDNIVENNETFFVNVTSVVGAGVSDAQGQGTITNDDAAVVTLSGGIAQTEGNAGTVAYTFTATLNNPVQGGFTVPYTTGGGTATAVTDYTDNDGTLTFAGTAGEMQTWTVNVNGDVTVELDETFEGALGAIAGAPAGVTTAGTPQTSTITNDDVATVNILANVSQLENVTPQTFSVTLSNPVDVAVTVDFSTAAGTATAGADYTSISNQTVTFPAGSSANQTVDVTIVNENIVEADETYTVSVANVQATGRSVALGANASRTGTILNEDAAVVTLSGGIAQNEGNAGTVAYTFTATLNNPVQGGFTVPYTTGGGTATALTDYVDNDGTLTFAGTAGEMQTWTVNVNGDVTVELNETFEGALGAIAGAPAGVTTAGTPQTSTITNDDAATVNILANVSQLENVTPQTFSVTLSNPVDVPVTVDFSTAAGTATAGADYTSISNQTVTFPAGSTANQTVDVTIANENIVEADETYTASVANLQATGRSVSLGANASRTGTILNEDAAVVTLSGGIAQNEGNAGTVAYTFTATLNNPVQGGFTVPYTTGGGTATAVTDYTDNDGTLTFAGTAGETQTWTVNVNGDVTVELDETFEGALGAIAGAPAGVTTAGSPQTSTITNDDAATVAIAGNVSGPEATTPQNFSVTLSNPVDVNVTVLFNTSDGTAATADNDYTGITNQTVTFLAGTTTAQTVPVAITNDSKVEANEIYNVAIGSLSASDRNVSLGTAAATGTITNDDNATVTLSGNVVHPEGNTGLTDYVFTVTLNNPVQGGFSVNYNTNNSSASFGSDYIDNDGNLTFVGTANEVQTIIVQGIGDFIVENNESFRINLNFITGDPIPGTVTFGNAEAYGDLLNDEIDYGDAPDSYSTLLASNGARHNAFPTLFLGNATDGDADGQPTGTANGDDTDAEGDDEDGVSLPNPLITNVTANVVVRASAPGFLDGWVDYDNNGDFSGAGEKVFNSIAVVAGNNNLSFLVPNGATPALTFARFRLSSTGGLSFNGLATNGEVEDYQVQIVNTQFSISDPVVTEGNAGTSNLAFVISRSNNASDCSVNYTITGGTATTADNDYQPLVAGTASFTADGALTQTINVVVVGDVKVELDETVEMTLSNPVNGSILDGSGTGTITNDDEAILTITNPTVTEGDVPNTATATFTINMSNPSDADVSVNYNTVDNTATLANNDYQSTSGTHTFSPGQTSKTVAVTVVGDCAVEANETYFMRLSGLANNGRNVILSGGGSTLDGTGTITNDDALPVITCPMNANYNTITGQCNALVTLPLPTTSSVCGSSTLEFRYRPVNMMNTPTGSYNAYAPSSGNTVTLTPGRYEIEWQVTDQSGSSVCSHFINVIDAEPPMAVCSNGSFSFNGDTSFPLNVNNLVSTSDNCGVASVSLSPTSITCEQVGQVVPVLITVLDVNGNTATCTSNVTVGGLPCGWSQNPDGVGCEDGNSIAFNSSTGVWTATSTNCFYASPFNSDETAFAQRTLCGNGSITALVTGISGNALGWAGIVMRESNAAGAKKAQLMTNLSNLSRREFRTAANAASQPQQFPSQNRYWLRITRTGNQFTMFVSANGISWFPAGTQNIVMPSCIQMGLVATNYTANSTVTATFTGVSFTDSNPISGTNINEVAESIDAPHGFEVYPNPTNGELNVDLTNYVGRAVRLEVYSLEGKLLQFSEVDEVETHIHTLDMSKLHTGMYLIRVKSAGIQDAVQKAVLQRK